VKKTSKYFIVIVISSILYFFLTVTASLAQTPKGSTGTAYQPIMNVDLGITSLTLEPGESYSFSVTFEPENPGITRLGWFNSDETVVALDGLTNTVTALSAGTATLMAESFDGISYALCEVTVSGPQMKDLSEMIEGKTLIKLSDEDRAKIDADQINRYLDLLDTTVLSEGASGKIMNRMTRVIADVREGTAEAESRRALALGMSEAFPMNNVNKVSLKGTLSQLLEFVKDNEDLLRIFKVRDIYIFPESSKPSDNSRMQPKKVKGSLMLEDHVEALSSISKIMDMGFTGKGTTIAVIDTGLDKNHEQFTGRVIAENCFTGGGMICRRNDDTETCRKGPDFYGPCEDNDYDGICDDPAIAACFTCEPNLVCESGQNSSIPKNAQKMDAYNHGPHVAGIAAGTDGIAKDAKIISVNVRSETYSPAFVDPENKNPKGYLGGIKGDDLYKTFAWLLEIQENLKKQGTPISIINMSIGSGNYDHICDHDKDLENLFQLAQQLSAEGILIIAASGNEGYNNGITFPACYSNVTAVGALAGNETPYIVSFSNHSPLIDILAPGTGINSAYLVGELQDDDEDDDDEDDEEDNLQAKGPTYACTEDDDCICDSEGKNCYGKMDGTSQAAPFVSGTLALLMEAFPGKEPEDYVSMMINMSVKKVNERNSNDQNVTSAVSSERMKFDYPKRIVDFSDFPAFYNSIRETEKPLDFSRITEILTLHDMPKTGFSALQPQKLSVQPLSVQYNPTRLTIQIPKLGVGSEIVTVPYIDGEYPVEWLGNAVGMLEGSSLPGEGITILTGHNHLNTTEAGPFAFLRDMELNDPFMITDEDGNLWIYRVRGNYKIPADGFSSLTENLRENTLVLITCEDESIDGSYLHRRVIFAEI